MSRKKQKIDKEIVSKLANIVRDAIADINGFFGKSIMNNPKTQDVVDDMIAELNILANVPSKRLAENFDIYLRLAITKALTGRSMDYLVENVMREFINRKWKKGIRKAWEWHKIFE